MYFKVTRDGKPLVNRRYYYSEAFAIMGYVEYYLATGQEEVRQRALALFKKCITTIRLQVVSHQKWIPGPGITRGTAS